MNRKNTNPLADPELVRRFNERNRHDWCRGTKGIEHDWHWRDRAKFRGEENLAHSEEKMCMRCGKQDEIRTKSYSAGFLIQHYRVLRGLTTDKLAVAAKLDVTRLMGIETGAIEPRIKELCALTEALELEFHVSIASNNVENHRARWLGRGYEMRHYERAQHVPR